MIRTTRRTLLAGATALAMAAGLPAALAEAGYHADSVHGEIVDLTCEPDNMLVTQFSRQEGHQPVVEALHRIVINGNSELDLRAATQAVVGKLPANTYWYGTSMEGPTEPGISASCAWQHP